ncbi:GNAT family N-acetyltransferase [Paenibacillus radicis (ex Gao et al. 2016)]|uniref:Ribosomal-protein-alanine acetyltransferase n=1 Tax=Paenibacillus radicis (ex Gao et al. 2016) TaxID=1737354 RepID=A0A917HA69_9BACL|nr:GNAT family protein [Paenibacillus radicis (ex Gao et al. 2016)]GGG72640.1 putative ribosomal-protein-alanine acetyltransferase [Paenibacillus radicis (ex Gao et al. 2016)]
MSTIYLRYLIKEDAAALLDIKLRNRQFFQPFEPIRDESHFTLAVQEQEIAGGIEAAANDQSYTFGIFLQATDELIGRIALTGIARGPFQNAYLGYFVDRQHNGKGYATAAVSLCVEKAFSELGLHRVQAGVMPRNTASIRVLEKAGFRHEGLSQHYLKINGAWEDHEQFAITADS